MIILRLLKHSLLNVLKDRCYISFDYFIGIHGSLYLSYTNMSKVEHELFIYCEFDVIKSGECDRCLETCALPG